MQNKDTSTPPPPPTPPSPPSPLPHPDFTLRPADSIPFRCCTCQATVPRGTSWHDHAASKGHRDRLRQTVPSHADLLRRWLAEKLRRRGSTTTTTTGAAAVPSLTAPPALTPAPVPAAAAAAA